MKSRLLTAGELVELGQAFADVINYEAEDITAPIDPLTYKAPDEDTCLHIACLRGNLRAVQLLIDAGLDVNARGDMGYTPLHYARSAEIVKLLLQSGADPSIKNEFGSAQIGWSGLN